MLVSQFVVHLGFCFIRLRNLTIDLRMKDILTEIRNWDIPNRKQEGYQLEKHGRYDFILEHI